MSSVLLFLVNVLTLLMDPCGIFTFSSSGPLFTNQTDVVLPQDLVKYRSCEILLQPIQNIWNRYRGSAATEMPVKFQISNYDHYNTQSHGFEVLRGGETSYHSMNKDPALLESRRTWDGPGDNEIILNGLGQSSCNLTMEIRQSAKRDRNTSDVLKSKEHKNLSFDFIRL